MRTRASLPQTSYSWLGIAPPIEKTSPFTSEQKKRFQQDCKEMEKLISKLEIKVKRYHSMCQQYEKDPSSTKAKTLFKKMGALKEEIDKISRELNRSIEDAYTLSYLQKHK